MPTDIIDTQQLPVPGVTDEMLRGIIFSVWQKTISNTVIINYTFNPNKSFPIPGHIRQQILPSDSSFEEFINKSLNVFKLGHKVSVSFNFIYHKRLTMHSEGIIFSLCHNPENTSYYYRISLNNNGYTKNGLVCISNYSIGDSRVALHEISHAILGNTDISLGSKENCVSLYPSLTAALKLDPLARCKSVVPYLCLTLNPDINCTSVLSESLNMSCGKKACVPGVLDKQLSKVAYASNYDFRVAKPSAFILNYEGQFIFSLARTLPVAFTYAFFKNIKYNNNHIFSNKAALIISDLMFFIILCNIDRDVNYIFFGVCMSMAKYIFSNKSICTLYGSMLVINCLYALTLGYEIFLPTFFTVASSLLATSLAYVFGSGSGVAFSKIATKTINIGSDSLTRFFTKPDLRFLGIPNSIETHTHTLRAS